MTYEEFDSRYAEYLIAQYELEHNTILNKKEMETFLKNFINDNSIICTSKKLNHIISALT